MKSVIFGVLGILMLVIIGCGDSNQTTNLNVTTGAGGSVNTTVDCTNPANAENPACKEK